MRPHDRTVENDLALLAGRSHGVVTRAQLLGAGVTTAEIEWRLKVGALLREHRGVYRVGHRAPSVEARYLAAVSACGDGALLCGRAAAHVHGLVKGAAVPRPEVLTPTERRVAGVITAAVSLRSPSTAAGRSGTHSDVFECRPALRPPAAASSCRGVTL